jgi:hypothetical protein
VHGLGEVGQDLAGLGPVAMQAGQQFQRRAGRAAHQLLEQVEDAAAVGEPKHGPNAVGADAAGTHRQCLIEQRQAIAHGALGSARNQRQGVVLCSGALLAGDALEV